MAGRVVSLNVSSIREASDGKRQYTTAIGKRPVVGTVALRRENLAGDDQADRENHGGPTRAVYAYATDDYRWWDAQLGRTLEPGVFGENLTLATIDVSGALIGERWRVGTAVLQVTSPRVPCYKLAAVMHDAAFVKRFADALRPGAYLSIVDEGEIAAGDAVEIVSRPEHDLTIREMTRLYFFDRARAREMLRAPELPEQWQRWAHEHGEPSP